MTDTPTSLNAAGLRALDAGQPGQAVTLLRRAVAADATSPLLWYNLANAHLAADDTASHDIALDEALTLDPYFGHALLAKGRLLEGTGDAMGAIAHYQRLLAAIDSAAPMGPGFAAGIEAAAGAGWCAVCGEGSAAPAVVAASAASIERTFTVVFIVRFQFS